MAILIDVYITLAAIVWAIGFPVGLIIIAKNCFWDEQEY